MSDTPNEAVNASNIRPYFTEDVLTRMNNISKERMTVLLKELADTEMWYAILKYNQSRLSLVQQTLYTADPVKEPTLMSRNQGIMVGLSDLQNAVISLVLEANRPKDEDGE